MRKLEDLMEALPLSLMKQVQRVVEIILFKAACCVLFIAAIVTGLITFGAFGNLLVTDCFFLPNTTFAIN